MAYNRCVACLAPTVKPVRSGVPAIGAVVVQIPGAIGEHADLGSSITVPVADHRDRAGEAEAESFIYRWSVPAAIAVVIQVPETFGIHSNLGSAVTIPITEHKCDAGPAEAVSSCPPRPLPKRRCH